MTPEMQNESLILKEIFEWQDMLDFLISKLQPIIKNTISSCETSCPEQTNWQTKVMESITMLKWRIRYLIDNVII